MIFLRWKLVVAMLSCAIYTLMRLRAATSTLPLLAPVRCPAAHPRSYYSLCTISINWSVSKQMGEFYVRNRVAENSVAGKKSVAAIVFMVGEAAAAAATANSSRISTSNISNIGTSISESSRRSSCRYRY